MLYITICFTLLVILASLHFLAKLKTEGSGKLLRWAAYLVILVASLILLCQLSRGLVEMRHHFREPRKTEYQGHMEDGMRGERGMWRHKDGCCPYMKCCDGPKSECKKDTVCSKGK